MTAQLDAFPCLVTSYQPFPKQQTAYARGRAIGEDGLAYIIKGNVAGLPICATEWISTAIAEALHLPIAPSKVLKMPDGELVFGSAEFTNKLPDSELASLLVSGLPPNGLFTEALPSLLSRVYALDLFLGNYDRHLSNFVMSLEWSDDRATRRGNLRAIDFDAGDFLLRSEITVPMNPKCNTVVAGRMIRAAFPYDNQPVVDMLTRLRDGREFMFEQAMYGLPPEWLSATERAAFLKRVKSNTFEGQIVKLEQGLTDGSYL